MPPTSSIFQPTCTYLPWPLGSSCLSRTLRPPVLALHGHQVCCASRENTTVGAIASFVYAIGPSDESGGPLVASASVPLRAFIQQSIGNLPVSLVQSTGRSSSSTMRLSISVPGHNRSAKSLTTSLLAPRPRATHSWRCLHSSRPRFLLNPSLACGGGFVCVFCHERL